MKDRKGKGEPRGGSVEGIVRGLSDILERLGELAERRGESSHAGEFRWGEGKDLKGVCGFSVRVGLGGRDVEVDTFGNIRKDEKSGQPVVQEVREPIVDIFEEEDFTLIVAEMPGISAQDLGLEVKDDLLTIHAEKGDKKYHKEVLLPRCYPREKMQVACNNGILEIRCSM